MALRLKNIWPQNVSRTIFKTKFDSGIAFLKKLKNFETPERLKGTFLERWGQFWKQLYIDYKDVAIDVYKESMAHPIKASFYISVIGSCFYFNKNNPDKSSFREELLQNSMKMIYVGEMNRNPVSVQHLEWLTECCLQGLVRRLNLGILSFIWLDNYNESCAIYKATCPYLKPRYLTFHQRIVDVGFINTWWILRKKMKNYDVNEKEFVHLN